MRTLPLARRLAWMGVTHQPPGGFSLGKMFESSLSSRSGPHVSPGACNLSDSPSPARLGAQLSETSRHTTKIPGDFHLMGNAHLQRTDAEPSKIHTKRA